MKTFQKKRWWNVAKQFLKTNKSSYYPPMQYNNTLISENVEKTNAFNSHFLSRSSIDDTNASLPECDLDNNDNVKLTEIKASEQEVFDMIKCIDISKSTGPELISPCMPLHRNHTPLFSRHLVNIYWYILARPQTSQWY